MGGRAVAALSALTLPSILADAALTLLIGGIAEAADSAAAPSSAVTSRAAASSR